jgi:hypothetical protein
MKSIHLFIVGVILFVFAKAVTGQEEQSPAPIQIPPLVQELLEIRDKKIDEIHQAFLEAALKARRQYLTQGDLGAVSQIDTYLDIRVDGGDDGFAGIWDFNEKGRIGNPIRFVFTNSKTWKGNYPDGRPCEGRWIRVGDSIVLSLSATPESIFANIDVSGETAKWTSANLELEMLGKRFEQTE